MTIEEIIKTIQEDPINKSYTDNNIEPLFHVNPKARILIAGQAPGIRAQESRIVFNDPSGDILRDWMGIDKEIFYNSSDIAVLPMDYYFPGKGKSGDLPPRKEISTKYNDLILSTMPNLELYLIIGKYAQEFYFGKNMKKNLTETVRNYEDFLPYFPLVHPSPRNNIWHSKNPWFKEEVLPVLKVKVQEILEA